MKQAKRPYSVLVVDDTKPFLLSLRHILMQEGYEVLTATNGKEALEIMRATPADIALLDIDLGEGSLDGITLCEEFKRNPRTAIAPVIFLTAHDDVQYKVQGFEAGGVDFIPKNYDRLEVLTRIKNHLQLAELRNGLQRENRYTQAILDAQRNFICIFDAEGNLEGANAAFKQQIISGFSNDFELVKLLKSYGEHLVPADDAGLLRKLEQTDDFRTQFRVEGQAGKVYSVYATKNTMLGAEKTILVFADITVHEKARMQELELLKYNERYHNNQQKDAFKKQLKIIKDDISHMKMGEYFFDSYYRPLDVLSGDTYGTIRVAPRTFLFYIIDAMGKGLSASVTSIQSTSFINNAVHRACTNSDFDFKRLLESYMSFIRRQVLEEELVCALFVLMDMESESYEVASYGMPPLLYQTADGDVQQFIANNPPIMSFLGTCKIDTLGKNGDIMRMLLYSDGLNETTCKDGQMYRNYIHDDFARAPTLRQLVRRFEERAITFDDDLTAIFIKKPKSTTTSRFMMEIKSTVEAITQAVEEFSVYMDEEGIDFKTSAELGMVVNELLVNALEHGSLGITSEQKQELLEEDRFDEYVAEMVQRPEIASKHIRISASTRDEGESSLIVISIGDPGQGFEYHDLLKTLTFQSSLRMCGRGITMTQQYSDGVFFNEQGNLVTLIRLVRTSHDGVQELLPNAL